MSLRALKGNRNGLVGLTPDGQILHWPTLHQDPRLRRIKPKRLLISDATPQAPGYTLSRRKYIDYTLSVDFDEIGVDEQGELRILSHLHPELPLLVARLKAGGARFTRVWTRDAYELEEYTRLTTLCVLTEAKAMRCASAGGLPGAPWALPQRDALHVEGGAAH